MSLSRRAFFAALIILCIAGHASAQSKKNKQKPVIDPSIARNQWVDSVYNRLSMEERIGQLFMVAAYSGTKAYNEELITKLIDAHQSKLKF